MNEFTAYVKNLDLSTVETITAPVIVFNSRPANYISSRLT